jgi:hypothetical protein
LTQARGHRGPPGTDAPRRPASVGTHRKESGQVAKTKDVRAAVEKELDFDPRVDSAHVRTWAEHDAVIGAASMAIGVIDIRDNLQITG